MIFSWSRRNVDEDGEERTGPGQRARYVEKAREPLMALAEQHVATITRGPGEGGAALGPWHPETQAAPSAH